MSLDEFLANPGVPVSVAAAMLGVGRTRVIQLLDEGKLRRVSCYGQTYVSAASIKTRQDLLKQRRKK